MSVQLVLHGEVIEIGNLQNHEGERGFEIEAKDGSTFALLNIPSETIRSIGPNLLFKNVRLTLELTE